MKSLRIQFACMLLLVSVSLQAQWVKTNGPNGGFVTDFTQNGNSIFATTGTIGGIFRSDDGGFSWITVKNGLPESYGDPSTIIVKSNIVFAGGFSLGLFRSTDNGNSWVDITNNIAISFITQLYVHNDILFDGTYIQYFVPFKI